MGSGDWLKNIINLSKVRKPKSKKTKDSLIPASNKLEPQPQEKKPEVAGMLVEDIAATRIQAAYRAFMAGKALRHLKGVLRLQIRTRRLHMVEEGGIRRKKLENQLKLETKLHELEDRYSVHVPILTKLLEWSGGSHTMNEALARIQQREEAAVKRERAMAYAFSHQWRPNLKSNLGLNDSELATANWGWSWLDRWIVAQPWESRVLVELTPKEVNKNLKSPLTKNSNLPKTSSNGKKCVRNRKLSYAAATITEDANTKTETLATK